MSKKPWGVVWFTLKVAGTEEDFLEAQRKFEEAEKY